MACSRTWLAELWLVGLLAVGTLGFDRAYPTHIGWAASRPTPPFHPVAYTLDVLLPVVDLGQQAPGSPGRSLGQAVGVDRRGGLITVVVAGLTRILKCD